MQPADKDLARNLNLELLEKVSTKLKSLIEKKFNRKKFLKNKVKNFKKKKAYLCSVLS